MHYKPLFDVGMCLSYGDADYSVPCASQESIERNRKALADMLDFLAKAMRNGTAPFGPMDPEIAKKINAGSASPLGDATGSPATERGEGKE